MNIAHPKKIKLKSAGFLLAESVISIGIFAVLMLGIYEVSTLIIKGVGFAREEITISALADQYLEVARNLPYSDVGTINGNPHGILPDLPNAVVANVNGVDYKIYYAVSYVDDSSDGTVLAGDDFAPNDYKQIKLYVENTATDSTSNFLTNIVPKGLENLENGGALYIKVFDAVGQPISGATIKITNSDVSPAIDLTRTSDSNGNWIEVGLPNSDNSYHIVVTKSGYSSDQTYPISASNPNPTKPDSTIANGQVTEVSFSIDLLSNLTISTLNQTCNPISDIGVSVKGSKLIGTGPDLLKFDNNYITDTNGKKVINNIEWDNYTPTLTGNTYMVYGSSPVQQINILPNTSQTESLILGPSSNSSVLVIVKDASSGNPIEGATVTLHSMSSGEESSKITGGSIWSQNNWIGGPGQTDFIDSTKYFEDNGGISVDGTPSGVRLANFGGHYVNAGSLTSSIFDTGTDVTSYTTLFWQPTSQNPSTSLKFQIATSDDPATTTWDFIGPDGTNSSFYITPGETINSVNNNKRYVRYKAYLQTEDDTQTPVLSSTDINYVSGCFTPGQVMFPDVETGTYSLTANADGYLSETINDEVIEIGYNTVMIFLNK